MNTGDHHVLKHLSPGIDVLFILAITCLSKERKDRQWYHRIDDKRGRW